MESREKLFYGLGLVAYSIAGADGKVQAAEKNELHSILEDWIENLEVDFEVSEIIFNIVSKSKTPFKEGFDLGMKHIRESKDYLTEKLKEKFIYLIKDIAHAYPPVTSDEKSIIESFEREINAL